MMKQRQLIRGISVTNGLFGVYVDGGSGNLLDSIEVFHIGQEGVTFADFSSDNVLRNSDIHDTGVSIPEYGEGVYIGSPIEHWAEVAGGQPDRSDRNQVLDNTIGPDVRAEQVDVKRKARREESSAAIGSDRPRNDSEQAMGRLLDGDQGKRLPDRGQPRQQCHQSRLRNGRDREGLG